MRCYRVPMGRSFVSVAGRWNVGRAMAIGLFIFGDDGFGDTGAAIGLFAFSVGWLSCCGLSLGACPAAGIEDNKASVATAPAPRKTFINIVRPFLKTDRMRPLKFYSAELIWILAEAAAD
jgi:hypothetical protein